MIQDFMKIDERTFTSRNVRKYITLVIKPFINTKQDFEFGMIEEIGNTPHLHQIVG